MKKVSLLFIVFAMLLSAIACVDDTNNVIVPTVETSPTLNGVFDADMKLLEEAGLFEEFSASTGIALNVSYKGSVDIKNQVKAFEANPGNVDIFGAPSAIWLPGQLVQGQTTIMKTYVVLGVDPALALERGWDTETGIYMEDLAAAIEDGKLSLAMPSASQDDAGANFFLAVLSSFKGNGETLRMEDLSDANITEPTEGILAAVNRGASHAEELRNVFVEDRVSGSDRFNAFVLPEVMAISVNQELQSKGETPMVVFYVKDAVSIQNFRIGYVSGISEQKQGYFKKLVEFLTSPQTQERLQALGFRTSFVGMTIEDADESVFNPEWGINTEEDFVLMNLPKDEVIYQALNLYQISLRKPSVTVYCLDKSGSMAGNGGNEQMNDAMDLLLDQARATDLLLQAGPEDITTVLAFNYGIVPLGTVVGNDSVALKTLSQNITNTPADGGTAMFECAKEAINQIASNYHPEQYNYSVVLLTDGESNQGISGSQFSALYQEVGLPIPVYSIAFGSASQVQLHEFDQTTGTICDGTSGGEQLVICFRNAKGSN